MSNLEILEDACATLRHTTRAMFGGHGLFAPNDGMFAGIVDDGIVLKLAEEKARAELEALGGRAWVYNNTMTMKQWILIPDHFYDEPRVLAEWAARAWKLAPAKIAKAGAPKKAAGKTGAAKKGAEKAPKKAAKKAGAAKRR